MSQNNIDNNLIQEAATWMMRLSDDNASATDWENWRQWTAQSEQHQKLAQLTESLGGKLHSIPTAVGRTALNAPRDANRRRAMKALTLLLTAAPAGWLAMQLPWQDWRADYRTNTGARRQITLPEGTQLTLDTASAVNIVFDQKQRTVELVSGRLFVATAVDNVVTARPFVVRTSQGLVRAIGTRFEVRKNAEDSHVAVLQGAVEITPAGTATAPLVMHAGQQTNFTPARIDAPAALGDAAGLWLSGRIQVSNIPLGDLIRELARYRPGVLRCDPDVAAIRVSGTYRVDDTDLALELLRQTFPLRVSHVTPYWVTVAAR